MILINIFCFLIFILLLNRCFYEIDCDLFLFYDGIDCDVIIYGKC